MAQNVDANINKMTSKRMTAMFTEGLEVVKHARNYAVIGEDHTKEIPSINHFSVSIIGIENDIDINCKNRIQQWKFTKPDQVNFYWHITWRLIDFIH
jgi:hypothetical protein